VKSSIVRLRLTESWFVGEWPRCLKTHAVRLKKIFSTSMYFVLSQATGDGHNKIMCTFSSVGLTSLNLFTYSLDNRKQRVYCLNYCLK